MSKPRYDWWPYVKGIIRRFPALKERYDDLHEMSVTAHLSDMPRGSGERTLENIAIRELPTTQQREYEAVRKAIELTEHYKNGRKRLELINMVFWKQTHTLAGAALNMPCSERTARQIHGEFIRLVASFYGLMD